MKTHELAIGVVVVCGLLGTADGLRDRWRAQAEREYRESVAPHPESERPEPVAAPEAPQWRDAVAAPAAAPAAVLAAARVVPMAPPPGAAARQAAVSIPKGAPMVKPGAFKALLASPSKFIVESTWLGRPEGFRAFAADPARVRRYLANPAVRAVLDNPMVLKALLSNKTVVKAFVESPAMKDAKTLKALGSSALMMQLGDTKAFAALAKDPGALQTVLSMPEGAAFFARFPQGMMLMGGR